MTGRMAKRRQAILDLLLQKVPCPAAEIVKAA